MCIIITSDTEFPFNRVLELAERKNPHGGGIAWIENDKVKWKKGLNWQEIGKLRHKIKSGPWLIHFRIATNGGICDELTHPFPVGMDTSLDLDGESDALIAHNGHWFSWQSALYSSVEDGDDFPDGKWSDSRAIAWILGKYGEEYVRFIPNQRIAYLDKNGIRRYGDGWLRHGPLWLSNDLFSGKVAHSCKR